MSKLIFLILLFCSNFCIADSKFVPFWQDLYEENKNAIERKLTKDVKNLLKSTKSISKDSAFNLKVTKILFYHALFTSSNAENFNRAGILEIPYFWHWVDPNPRHVILHKPSQKKLNQVKPPKNYKKYKSFADIDRTPKIYIENLLSEKPLFYHSRIGDFYSFGWCSEREMAFSLLMKLLGYATKIKQEGIHTWSEVLLKFKKNEFYSLVVDNTFNTVDIYLISDKQTWKSEVGKGAQINWYNKKAKSKSEIKYLKNLLVDDSSKNRFENKIQQWLNSP